MNWKFCTHPYVNLSFGSQVAITEANRPTPIAMQSNAMWIANAQFFNFHSAFQGITTYHQISAPNYSSIYHKAFVWACSTCSTIENKRSSWIRGLTIWFSDMSWTTSVQACETLQGMRRHLRDTYLPAQKWIKHGTAIKESVTNRHREALQPKHPSRLEIAQRRAPR